MAWAGLQALAALPAGRLPRADEIGIDPGVLAFTLGVSVVAALAFGVLPALVSARTDLRGDLQGTAGSTGSAGSRLMLSVLVVAEVAIALVLLVGAGLLARSLDGLLRVDPGFSADGVAVAQIYLPRTRYRAPHDQARFFDELLARLRGAPGVTTAGATSALPLHPVGLDFALPFTVEGRLPPADEVESRADIRIVTPGYVETLRIPLLRGRLIDERDTADAPHVMLINQSLARRYFGDDDPLGRFITNPHGRAEVVGVVGDVRHYGLDATPRAELYLPYDQNRLYAMAVVVRATGDAGSTMPLLRQTAADVDAAQPIRDLTTLDRVLAGAVFLPRASLQLVGAFALAALLLAAVGIYGVLAYAVSQQTRDIGVRMALGADRHDALRLVLARSLRLAAAGSVAGLALAWPATRAMRAALYDVDALDPVVVGSVVALLTFVALGAALVPGLRATRVEPVVALKAD